MIETETNKEEIIENIIHSTESALMALTQLEKNLIEGGFKEGIEPYVVMCKTLIGQRIWSGDTSNEEINRNFKEISITAQSIVDILLPYVENLKKLAILDGKVPADYEAQTVIAESKIKEFGQDQEKIIDLISNMPEKRMSYSKLRSSLGWQRKKLDEILASFGEDSGAVKVVMFGSRKIVKL